MTPSPDFATYLQQCQQRVEKALEQHLPAETIPPQKLHQAMRYAVLGPGKRIRPVLVYAAGLAVDAQQNSLDIPACAVELIHAYSLVHDDLPAMDDDDLRRGRATCHKAFNEATAILTGDALQTLAFRVITKLPQGNGINPLLMVQELSHASGSRGMAGGQALDIAAMENPIDLAQLENMHIHKTGALIRASVRLGMLCAPHVDQQQFKLIDRYAKCIGLAFQVHDDVLDITSSTQKLGKTQGKDIANNKPTYPALLGLDGARDMAQQLLEEALDNLSSFGGKATPLRQLATYIVGRDH
jgi:geranylgeranyl pyrophosphate synthase